MTWFAHKPAEDVRVVIDIGSMSLKTVLFEKKGQNISVLKKLVTELPVRGETLSVIKFVNASIREELFKIIKDIHRVPKKIIIGLSGEYVENAIETVAVERPHKTRSISEDEIAAVFKKGIEDISTRHGKTVVIDSFPVRVRVDGYDVEGVYKDMKGSKIEIFIFASCMKKEYWDQFKNLSHILGGVPIRFVSNQFVNAFSIPKIIKVPSALLVDIGARATEVSLVQGEKLYSVSRFASGGDIVTRSIAKALNIEYADANAVKRQYQEQVLPQTVVSKIQGAVRESVASWRKEFIASLSLDQHCIIPDNVFIFGGGASIPDVREFLESGGWASEFSWKQKIPVSFLSAEKISHGILEAGELTGFNEVSFLSLIFYSYLVN
ncbi:MAG: hypothetical protein HYW88_02920 [Candidatus Sungbacteria bacterium]|nr:hypothetical protein [Candidatus Sungbacteria bacterium]